jgi:DNA-binding GntR family transcriptional regulator
MSRAGGRRNRSYGAYRSYETSRAILDTPDPTPLISDRHMVKPLSKLASRPRNSSGPRQSQADRAYLEIRNSILKGNLPVGVALSRRKLASELHISVPPVTEALLRLESEGLVESKPRVGTRVRIPTRQEVEDRSLLREALETQAARLFAERATASEKKALHRMGREVDRLYAACEKGSVDREFLFSVNTRHMELHLRIAECGRCPALRDAIEKEQVLIFNWLYDTAVQRRTLGSDYHSTLTAALTTGSPARAQAAMRRHIRRGLTQVLCGLGQIGKTEHAWRSKSAPPAGSESAAGFPGFS